MDLTCSVRRIKKDECDCDRRGRPAFGASFEPVCDEPLACIDAKARGELGDPLGACKCSGQGAPTNPVGLEIVDMVLIPADLPAGEFVLGWRWDCEQTPQVWSSCSDVTITASGVDVAV